MEKVVHETNELPNGVMLNAYPDSIGRNLADTVSMLKRPEFHNVFSLFYILPTFFNSDLDRGFSIIDYDINKELVTEKDVKDLHRQKIMLKFDLVLNHLSVGSPQFQDMLKHGDFSEYKDFFIDWNEFWEPYGKKDENGIVIPDEKYLNQLFMRKPGLPILKVQFPDGSERPYWNTFYQEITYEEIDIEDLAGIKGLTQEQAENIAYIVNSAIANKKDINEIDLEANTSYKEAVLDRVKQRRKYLGQMDLNAKSEGVWDFYRDTFKKLRHYGCRIVRLDAFAYLHKEPGKSNFFNKPGTWDYLSQLKSIAGQYDILLLPEIHSEYGTGLHEEVAGEGFPIYDFFFPGLVIHALEKGDASRIARWVNDLQKKGIKTVNMLGSHDGIPVLDLKGSGQEGNNNEGLLSDDEINEVIECILSRGGRVKNLFGPDGKKISYYQVNATFFSALGEDEQKMLLARAIQIFMPGIPQVWYLDLFAGTNDYAAADHGGTGGHKEINRTTLTEGDIENGLKKLIVKYQLRLMHLRNTSSAFNGELEIKTPETHLLEATWRNGETHVRLKANLRDYRFTIDRKEEGKDNNPMSFA
ncbi:MAG: glycosidase [Nitrospinae bacterium]|nr:glycosidase [Nitrospinota bacterium]